MHLEEPSTFVLSKTHLDESRDHPHHVARQVHAETNRRHNQQHLRHLVLRDRVLLLSAVGTRTGVRFPQVQTLGHPSVGQSPPNAGQLPDGATDVDVEDRDRHHLRRSAEI